MRIMRARSPWLAVAALFLVVGVLPTIAAADRREGEPFHWSARMAPGKMLRVHGINGRIHVEQSAGAVATVDGEKWAMRGDPNRVRIEIEENDDGVSIRARSPRRWGAFGSDNVNVDFTVRVPAGVKLDLGTVNGSIEAEGLQNRVSASTVNGAIRIETGGEAEARTVNGSITARATPLSGDLAFRTVNGSVRLELPAESSARVSAHTINGSIRSDFPVRIRAGFIGHSLRGTLGEGGADLEIHTVNGSIQLRRI